MSECCDCDDHRDFRRPCSWAPSENGQVPAGAVCGGADACSPTYVCRVCHQGDMVVGALVPQHGFCHVAWKGSEYTYDRDYEVLCNPDGLPLGWVWASAGAVPAGVVQGGWSGADGEAFYVGRHRHEGAVVLGTVVPSRKSLFVAFGKKVFAYFDYQVLVNAEAANAEEPTGEVGGDAESTA